MDKALVFSYRNVWSYETRSHQRVLQVARYHFYDRLPSDFELHTKSYGTYHEYRINSAGYVRFLCGAIDHNCPDNVLDSLEAGNAFLWDKNGIREFNPYPEYTAENVPLDNGYWIARDGTVFHVGYAGHAAAARVLVPRYLHQHDKTDVSDLEANGWIHISGPNVYAKHDVNDRQYDTLSALKDRLIGMFPETANSIVNAMFA